MGKKLVIVLIIKKNQVFRRERREGERSGSGGIFLVLEIIFVGFIKEINLIQYIRFNELYMDFIIVIKI